MGGDCDFDLRPLVSWQSRRMADFLPLCDGVIAVDVFDSAGKQSEKGGSARSRLACRIYGHQRLCDISVFTHRLHPIMITAGESWRIVPNAQCPRTNILTNNPRLTSDQTVSRAYHQRFSARRANSMQIGNMTSVKRGKLMTNERLANSNTLN